MGIFGLKIKEEKTEKNCCCIAGTETAENINCSGRIKILGGGCAKCHELETNTKAAFEEMGVKEDVLLITDFSVIAAYGVMSTPALVMDDKVVSYGKVLKKDEIIKLYKSVSG